MISGISSDFTSSGTSADSSAGGAAAKTDPSQVTKNMFLQLLVAQIKNQDPMSPSDGVQFLTQLAQFQQLEQSMNTGQDIAAVRADLDKLATAATPATN
jgi:flagellar basal-body rod modification protein FlgD